MGFPYPYPLGLPRGTVRATITIIYTATMTYFLFSGNPVYEKLGTSVAIMVAFYFGGKLRGTMTSGAATLAEERAFGLPSKTVRTILTIDIFGTWLYMYLKKQIIPPFLNEFVTMIGGYILGAVFHWVKKKLFGVNQKGLTHMWIEHLKALIVLGFAIWFNVSIIIGLISAEANLWFQFSYLLVGFYYGERK